MTLSTSEAEYLALGDAAKEQLFFYVGVAFHVAWERYAVFFGVGG